MIATGNLTAAIRLAQTIHEQDRQRAAADPTNTGWQRDFSVSHNRLGDLARAAGDLAAAGQHYTANLAIAERLAATWPDAFLLDLARRAGALQSFLIL